MRGCISTVVFLWGVGCADHKVGVYNTPPEVSIIVPAGGENYEQGNLVEFDALARDSQDDSDELSVSWSSQLDGFLGEAPPSQSGEVYLGVSALSQGEHVITLTAIDTHGDSAQISVDISIGEAQDTGDPDPEGTAPTVLLAGPMSGESYELGEIITFVGKASDPDQAAETLQASLVSHRDGVLWEGNPDEKGWVESSSTELTVGEHVITLRAVDDQGLEATDETTIEVIEDQRPVALITNPLAGDIVFNDTTTTLEGEVSDDQTDAELLAVTWSSDLDGELFTGYPDSSGYTATSVSLSQGTHILSLIVVDEDAQEGSDDISFEVYHPDDYDDDGDGYTENEGDCDDDDISVSPGEAEQCDDLDNDCDGYINEDWWDSYEENESSADAYYLGEVDEDSSLSGSEVTVSGLTLHEEADEDWIWWWADDEWYDDVDVYVYAEGLSGGDFVIELYMEDGGSWDLQDSDSGSGTLSVSKGGDWLSDDDDNWAIRVYSTSWPVGSCSTTYTLTIGS
jgi:hypothetical protein